MGLFKCFFLVDRRDGKAVINSHTQSGGTGVRTPVMTSGLTISAFLPVVLGLMGRAYSNVNKQKHGKYKKDLNCLNSKCTRQQVKTSEGCSGRCISIYLYLNLEVLCVMTRTIIGHSFHCFICFLSCRVFIEVLKTMRCALAYVQEATML